MKPPKVTAGDVLRFPAVILLWVIQWPLMVLFYIVRSAWYDAANIGLALRKSEICEHGVDRVRRYCETCDEMDMARRDEAFSAAVHGHRN